MRRLTLSFVIAVATAFAAAAQPPEDVVRRFVVLAYDAQFERLPVTQSVRMEQFERKVRNVLRVRCVRVENVAVTVLSTNSDRATVHAEVVISKTEPEFRPDWFALDTILLRLELTRNGDEWLVSEVSDRDDELADELARSNPDERERILEAHPERLTKGLARAVYSRGLSLLGAAKRARGTEMSELARRLGVIVGDRGTEALALGAASYVPASDPEQPVRLTQEAVAIAQTTDDVDVLARAWYDRGRSVRNRNDPGGPREELYACYRNARKFAERSEDPITHVRVLYSLGNYAAAVTFDFVAARRYVDEAMRIAREVDDETGQMGLEIVMASVYLNQGDRERGIFHHRRAMQLAERVHAPSHSTLLIRSAGFLVEDGKLDEASALLARVLTQTQSGLDGNWEGMAPAFVTMAIRIRGYIEAERGNLSEAECLIRHAATRMEAPPDIFLFELARYYRKRNDPISALSVCLKSLAEARLDGGYKTTALLEAARAYRSIGDYEQGLDAALEGIARREEMESRVAGDEQQRASHSTGTSDFYELASEITVGQGEPLKALAFLEQGRGRVLADIVEHGKPRAMSELDTALKQEQLALEREVTRVSVELDRARAAKDETAVKDLTVELDRVRTIRGSFADGVRARSERRQAAARVIDAASVREVVRRFPPRMVAVAYAVGERDVKAFVISRDGSGEPRVVVRTIATGREALERKVNLFLETLSARNLRVKSMGREIDHLLLEPIAHEIAEAEALLVVPDEILWRVPFAALVDRKGRYLAERTSVLYAPSLTAFGTIVESPRRPQSSSAALFAVGNPTLDVAERAAATSFYRNAELLPLPEAEHEVDALRALYDAKHSVVLKREEATEARTKAALRDATVAHFATHAIIDDGNPMYSRLMLARDLQTNDDGWLESWEVARLDLKADLVVLSACDTARGRIGGGEGVVGLSWSFFIAGARSTVATQWKVSSASTAQFMIAFHRELLTSAENPALRKAQAIRKVQQQMLNDEDTRHPFHWAAFVLLGDPSVR